LLCAASFAVHASFLTGCTTDAYDKGDGEYSLMQAEMADVHVDGSLKADFFVTDDGERLAVTNTFTAGWMKTADSTYRAVAYFNRSGTGAEVVAMNHVATLRPWAVKDRKTDPVRFESAWMSASGRYLNTAIYVLLGSTDNEKAIQTIGCHRDTLRRNSDGTRTQLLTLLHDQGGVPQYYSQRAYISIALDSIQADSVCLSINTYDGVVRKTMRTVRH